MTCVFFFFQAEDGIRDYKVTGVQTCALPISPGHRHGAAAGRGGRGIRHAAGRERAGAVARREVPRSRPWRDRRGRRRGRGGGIGRGAGRGRGEISGGARSFKKKKKKYVSEQ